MAAAPNRAARGKCLVAERAFVILVPPAQAAAAGQATWRATRGNHFADGCGPAPAGRPPPHRARARIWATCVGLRHGAQHRLGPPPRATAGRAATSSDRRVRCPCPPAPAEYRRSRHRASRRPALAIWRKRQVDADRQRDAEAHHHPAVGYGVTASLRGGQPGKTEAAAPAALAARGDRHDIHGRATAWRTRPSVSAPLGNVRGPNTLHTSNNAEK